AAVVAREQFDDQAGLAPRTRVQDEGRLLVDALLRAHGDSRRLFVAEALEGALVVGPAALHLDPDLEIHRAVEELLELHARLGRDALELLAALADDHALVAVAVDDDGGEDAAQPPLGLELLDLDGDAVGQLVTEQAEQLLAQELGGEEALAAVGDVVLLEHRRPLGQQRHGGRDEAVDVAAALGRQRHDGGEVAQLAHPQNEGQQYGLVLEAVDLVDDQHDLPVRRQQIEDLAVVVAEAPGLDDEVHDVHVRQ